MGTPARAIPSIVAVVVLGIAFGALLLDSTRPPAGLAPASAPPQVEGQRHQ